MLAFHIHGASSGRTESGVPVRLAAALALALSVGVVAPATSEIFRCVGDDGRVSFTDNRSACPSAGRHELQPRIQQVVEGNADTPRAPAAPVHRNTASEADDARAQQRQQWQGKKQRAQAEFQALQHRAERLERSVTGCNRGMDIFARERDTGLKVRLSCDDIRQAYVDTRAKARELREYLEKGLRQECRRAGCLPGWIR
jgi:hypothetical protein